MVDRRYLNINRMRDFREYLEREFKSVEGQDSFRVPFDKHDINYDKGLIVGRLDAFKEVLSKWDKITEE